MDERNVDHAVVITSYKVSADRPSVENILEVLKGNPRVTVVEGLRWGGKEKTDLFAMEERIREGLVRGIKLYPGYEPYAINDRSLEAVFQLAARHQIPVMIHTGDTYSKTAKVRYAHPLLVDDVAVDYPDVNFVLCHLGSPWFNDAAEVLYKNDNVYGDLSGLVLGEFSNEFERFIVRRVKEMILHMGNPGRQLLFGSDWPLVRMAPYVDFLENLKFSREALDAVRWRTAAKLFKIDGAASRTEAAPAARRGDGHRKT